MINFEIKINSSKTKKLKEAQYTALLKTAEQLRTEVIEARVIPFQTGNLQNKQTYIVKKKQNKLVAIVHDTPYAKRLYYHPEYKFDKTFNPNARGEWWEDWIRGKKKDRPKEIFKTFYKKETEGIVK